MPLTLTTECNATEECLHMKEIQEALHGLTKTLSDRLDDHDLLVRLAADMGHLIGEVRNSNDAIGKTMAAVEARVTTTAQDHERRIRMLERGWWQVAGAAGLAGALLSLVANKFL